jgi:hypothetical protein
VAQFKCRNSEGQKIICGLRKYNSGDTGSENSESVNIWRKARKEAAYMDYWMMRKNRGYVANMRLRPAHDHDCDRQRIKKRMYIVSKNITH